MKGKIYLKQLLLKNTYGKGLLVQIKEEEVYEVLTNKEFTYETNSPFEKIEPYKKFNTQWGTLYRSVLEFTK